MHVLHFFCSKCGWELGSRDFCMEGERVKLKCINIEGCSGWESASFRDADAAQVRSDVGFVAADGALECSFA
jgi:hypothetical protein